MTYTQAIFTQEQMDRVVDDLKLRTREINAETKRFVSDSEWLSIDQVVSRLRLSCRDEIISSCGVAFFYCGTGTLDRLPPRWNCFVVFRQRSQES